eukprot:TRINITY_DN1674_c0_g1_i1.p1 TRINITY_DN1674_c0_g1~~TRINITY_DN1674_c0_g1_i1.p1  ORF type:complete len:100 (-),score=2.55 TRINITY_DN1674_c0_g1_i1:113-412(-)
MADSCAAFQLCPDHLKNPSVLENTLKTFLELALGSSGVADIIKISGCIPAGMTQDHIRTTRMIVHETSDIVDKSIQNNPTVSHAGVAGHFAGSEARGSR